LSPSLVVIGQDPLLIFLPSSSSSSPLWASVVVDGHCSKVAVFDACPTEGGGVYSGVRPLQELGVFDTALPPSPSTGAGIVALRASTHRRYLGHVRLVVWIGSICENQRLVANILRGNVIASSGLSLN